MRPKQRRHFRPRLGEAEDVVDEEQHVLAFLVAEIFGDGEAREADALARARRLVHLAVDQRDFRSRRRPVVVELDDARLDHFVIKIVALARALADPGEHRITAVGFSDIVDQFHDDHGFADAGAAEQADLAALGVGCQQIDDLDAGDEDFVRGRLLGERRRGAVDRRLTLGADRAALVDRLADHVDDPAEGFGADRDRDGGPGVGHLVAAHQTVGRVHRDAAHGRFAEMLRHFEDQPLPGIVGHQRVQDRRQLAVELHVDDGAHDLGDAPDTVVSHPLLRSLNCGLRALRRPK